MMGFGLGMGVFGLALMGLFWGGLIALAIWLVRLLFPGGQTSPPPTVPPSPLEVLHARYARGELTEEEYQQIRQTLQQL
ncbi:SHOCT domain-containing protein [Candidatus Parcubacteria bacterium]|nr:MAG: SHOCT domain-containing protein [Candidatus Parcubacteria bacterium]